MEPNFLSKDELSFVQSHVMILSKKIVDDEMVNVPVISSYIEDYFLKCLEKIMSNNKNMNVKPCVSGSLPCGDKNTDFMCQNCLVVYLDYAEPAELTT